MKTRRLRSPGGRAAREMNRFLREHEPYYTRTKPVARIALMRSTTTMDYYHRDIEVSDFTRAERGPDASKAAPGWCPSSSVTVKPGEVPKISFSPFRKSVWSSTTVTEIDFISLFLIMFFYYHS